MKYLKLLFNIIKKWWATLIGYIFYNHKYLKGKYFDKYSYSDGWRWILETVFMQKIVGINRNVPFPVSFRATVCNWQNIEFDVDNINIFQKAGCYYQATENSKITIGKNCFIACNVAIITANHNFNDLSNHYAGKDVVIGENSWIGFGAVILPGVELGPHTIVGANAVVTKSFKEGNCVIAGNPAKIIKKIDPYGENCKMKILENQKDCVGCGACAASCPANSISMVPEQGGFLYPSINAQTCVSCGLCQKVCPVLSKNESITPLGCYALVDENKDSRMKSSSGGASNVFAKEILNENGYFCGVRLNENLKAIHDVTDEFECLDLYRDSKYVQSDMSIAWNKIESILRQNKQLLVTGTPCQIASVHSKFGDCENLITCDFVCSGVPDPKIFELYLQDLEDKYHKKIKEFYFRDKTNGWEKSNIRLVFEDNTEQIITRKDSYYFTLFGNNLLLRDCCFNCKFKNLQSTSDLTIGDYWGIEQMYPELHDDNGCSLVITNTKKGAEFFEKATKNCIVKETPLNFAMDTHSKIQNSAAKNPYRQMFYERFSPCTKENLRYATDLCTGTSVSQKIKRKILLKIKK